MKFNNMLFPTFMVILFVVSPITTQNLIGVKVYSGEKRTYCVPPPQPENGNYTLEGVPHPTIKNAYESFTLMYECHRPYFLWGLYYPEAVLPLVICRNGDWIFNIPFCVHSEEVWQGHVSLKVENTSSTSCVVPAHPRNGRYVVVGKPDAVPGDNLEFLQLTVTCDYRHSSENQQMVLCVKGQWSDYLPKCFHNSNSCELRKHPTMAYRCKTSSKKVGYCGNEIASNAMVELKCRPNYEDLNVWRVTRKECQMGYWVVIATCFPKDNQSTCELHKHPSVEYRCFSNLTDSDALELPCNDVEPAGTEIRIVCKITNIPPEGANSAHLFCKDSNWVHVTSCSPKTKQNIECGVTSINPPLVFGGNVAVRGELPWHVAIYSRTVTPYELICGGSIVGNNVVITAAHCFWDDVKKVRPASNYVVATDKLHKTWESQHDAEAQLLEVTEIVVPPLFRGTTTNFQEDIAVVKVMPQFEFGKYVTPVCLDFDFDFEKRQLRKGHMGKVGGWGLTSHISGQSSELRTVEMPYIPLAECMDNSLSSFVAYITGDKICAGTNGTAVCRGDSGGGLVFRDHNNGVTRFYLRGVVSTSPNSGEECDGKSWATFTSVNRHQHFLRDYL